MKERRIAENPNSNGFAERAPLDTYIGPIVTEIRSAADSNEARRMWEKIKNINPSGIQDNL